MQAQGIAALAPGQAAPMQNPLTQNNTPAAPNPGIPPDLKQLLSQQARNEMEQAAQRYQALQHALQLGQGTGKPPTIAQQVAMQSQRDMASKAGPAMQVQDQQKKAGLQALAEGQQGQADSPPQPQAQGIAELEVPEMGKAGGGIIAFSGADNSYVEGDPQALSDLKKWWQENMPDSIPGITGFSKEAKTAEFMRSEAERQAAEEQAAQEGAAARMQQRQPGSLYNYLFTPVGNAGRGQINPPPISEDAQAANAQATARIARQEGTPALPGVTTDGGAPPAPTAGPRPAPQQAPAVRMPVAPPTNSAFAPTGYLNELQQLVPKSLAGIMKGTSEDAENKAAQEVQNAGLADLLKAQRERAAALQARQQAAVDQRVPAWAMGAMGATQPRGAGLGSLLASWGAGANKAQQGYTAEDLANAAQLDKLNNDIDVAKYNGNMEVVKAKQEARKEFMGTLTKTQASAVQLIDAAKRSEDAAAARVQEAELRHMDLAQRIRESGDMKLLQQIESAKRAADVNATRQAEAEEKGKSATGDINPLVVQAKATQYAQAALAQDPVYQRAMKQYLGADYVAPKVAPATGDPRISSAPPAGKVLNAKT